LGIVYVVLWIAGAMFPPKRMSHVDELYALLGEAE
jgi:hypothetical protein